MYIVVDPKSGVPLYTQVKEQMRLAVATGALRAGDQVPTVRELAARVLINPNTVARAYRDLQAEGLLASRQGSGTFVADGAEALGQAESHRLVGDQLQRVAALAASLGVSARQFQQMAGQAHEGAVEQSSEEVDGNVGASD
jgi:GntR family transcriptional regulator